MKQTQIGIELIDRENLCKCVWSWSSQAKVEIYWNWTTKDADTIVPNWWVWCWTGFRAAQKRPHCQRCANMGRFVATLLLGMFTTGFHKTHVHKRGSKAWVMLRCSWQTGLQLEVDKRIATAAGWRGSSAIQSSVHGSTHSIVDWFIDSWLHGFNG